AALRAAHTLKGIAGTIGARPLQQRAAEVESGVNEDWSAAALEPAIRAVEEEVTRLVAALRAALPGGPRSESAAAIVWGRAKEILDRLESMLVNDDAEAVE